MDLKKIKNFFPDLVFDFHEDVREGVLVVDKRGLLRICEFLKGNSEFMFIFFVDVTLVDYLSRKPRFDVVYHLLSHANNYRLRIKAGISEEDFEVDSVTKIWPAANWPEREAYDMFGIKFKNHPSLTRILLPDDWISFPLRKDFPLGGQDD